MSTRTIWRIAEVGGHKMYVAEDVYDSSNVQYGINGINPFRENMRTTNPLNKIVERMEQRGNAPWIRYDSQTNENLKNTSRYNVSGWLKWRECGTD